MCCKHIAPPPRAAFNGRLFAFMIRENCCKQGKVMVKNGQIVADMIVPYSKGPRQFDHFSIELSHFLKLRITGRGAGRLLFSAPKFPWNRHILKAKFTAKAKKEGEKRTLR
jgi:hypothetical protein